MADNTGIHPLRSLKSGVSLILAGVALAAVCFGAGFFTGGRAQEEPPQLSSVTVEQQLQQISQLATTQYAYTNMGQFERGSDFYGIRIPFTIQDYNGFQADQQGVMEEKALQSGLLTQAQDQAEAAVTGLLTPLLDEGQALEVRTAEAET